MPLVATRSYQDFPNHRYCTTQFWIDTVAFNNQASDLPPPAGLTFMSGMANSRGASYDCLPSYLQNISPSKIELQPKLNHARIARRRDCAEGCIADDTIGSGEWRRVG